ncbi:transmembrane protein, putative (macronuclear) [Tetrahymena thermophila SB210]|uniref:Transmembrane protein, putative n=1 Tax=Tetrahymena thermophila (strain SB210) TaxID=312017 RepID=Q22KS6_TETTS|nr:transmembrane protein, putative [Tetrahymena thermophila SB210]EAR85723.1 transmembrane protein, putative [Tetrahymena thermophila SB210]|eukprot:XP_001033386.1 transmembrane protein, putative [Tetrahymena thermophila SB210]
MDINTQNKQQEVKIIRQDFLSFPIQNYVIGISLLGLTSYKFYQNIPFFIKWSKYQNYLKGIKNITAKDLNPNQIVHCSGQLKLDATKIIQDKLFSINSQQNMGLYRKVEIYKTIGKQQKEDWYNVNYLEQEQIPIEVKELKSQVLTNSDAYLDDYKLSNSLLQILAEGNCQQISLNKDNIIKYYESLKQQQNEQGNFLENVQQMKNESLFLAQNESKLSQIKQFYQNHPFKLSEETKKVVEVFDNSIYIVKTLEEISEGDIKISYYDINKIENITVLGQKQDNLITDFQVPELAQNNEIIEIKMNDNIFQFKVGQIGFAFKGNLDEKQVLKEFEVAVGEYTLPEFIIMCLLAFLYCYISDQFFADFKFSLSEEEMKEVAKKMVQKVNDTEINVKEKEKHKLIINLSALILSIIHFQAQQNLVKGIYVLPSTILLLSGAAYVSIEIKKVLEFSKVLEEEIKQQKQELQAKLLNNQQNQQQ